MLNHITIMGRLTRAPELRRTGNGVAVTSFTVAVDRDIKSGDGETDTDFIDCVAWRQTGEFVGKYFTKGRMAVVSGRLQIRCWTDKDGSKRRTAEVNALPLVILFCAALPSGQQHKLGEPVQRGKFGISAVLSASSVQGALHRKKRTPQAS